MNNTIFNNIIEPTYRFYCVIQTKVKTSVDENTRTRYPEASVQASDSISFDGLDVTIHDSVELSLTCGVLGIYSQPRPSVVYALDKHQ